MIKIIKELLLNIIDDLDTGNSNIPEDKQLEIIELLKEYTRQDKPMSKYQAYTYLNISRAKFDNMVRDGIIPEGIKNPGFKEKFFYKKDLDKIIKDKNK